MSKDQNDPPIIQIYDQINRLFGGKEGQLFMMEFPGRILDIGTYQYDAANTDNAQQTKPQTVAEAEFRLSDDIFTLAQLSGGPNGGKISQVYEEALNQLIPTASHDSAYATKVLPDQLVVTQWLLELVNNWEPSREDILADLPDTFKDSIPPQKDAPQTATDNENAKIPRVDLYQKLLDAYEDQRFRWEKFKLDARPKDDKNKKAWDLYNRTLSRYAPVIDKKLEAMWTTLVVRGEYHRVRHYVGMLDIETGSETLLRAKENLRSSVVRSIDDTQDVYPVQFSPATWANYLTTDFQPVDLLMDPKMLRQDLLDKQAQRQFLISRLGGLQSSQQDITALQKKADDARTAYDAAMNTMMQGYSDTAIGLIQMYFKTKGAKTEAEVKAVEKPSLDGVLQAANQPPLTDEQFNQLKTMQANAIKNQTAYQNASEAVARAQAGLAGGIASDPKVAMADTQRQIDALTAAIETLKSILNSSKDTGVTGFDDGTKTAKDAAPPPLIPISGDAPPPPAPKDGASEWTSITISYSHANSSNSKNLSSSSSFTSWNVSFFIGSASGSNSESSADAAEHMTAANTDIKIGFNVMKVTINRPWMDGTLFKQTKDYYRMSSVPISTGDDWIKVLSDPEKSLDEKNAALKAAEDGGLLPAYSVAFVIAKDVTMTLSNKFNDAGSASSYLEKNTSAGGGILCFSCSHSSHSSQSSQTAYTNCDATNINIRIPGPQIIGWFLQATPKDYSTINYEPIDRTQFKIA